MYSHEQEDQVVGKGWDGNDAYEKTLADISTELDRNKHGCRVNPREFLITWTIPPSHSLDSELEKGPGLFLSSKW